MTLYVCPVCAMHHDVEPDEFGEAAPLHRHRKATNKPWEHEEEIVVCVPVDDEVNDTQSTPPHEREARS